jgi:predicted secreted protein
MATVSVINTTLLAIYVEGAKVAHSTGGSIALTHAVRDITSKDSEGWRTLLEGLRSGTAAVNGLLAHDAATGGVELGDILIARTQCEIKFMTGVTGDTVYTADAYVGSCSQSSDAAEGNATYEASFEITGPIVKSTAA